jgi:hypothetical protein
MAKISKNTQVPQFDKTAVNSSDYRIKEKAGKFLIQKRITTIKKTGFFWLKEEEAKSKIQGFLDVPKYHYC